MLWKTHKEGAYTATIFLVPLLVVSTLTLNISSMDFYILSFLTFIIFYSGAKFGTGFPDFDQNRKAMPLKNPITYVLNFLIHLMPIQHRSFQTHSCDLYLLLVGIPSYLSYKTFLITGNILYYLLFVYMIAFISGAILHCIMDMFSEQGAWISIIFTVLWRLCTRSKEPLSNTRFSFVNLLAIPIFIPTRRGFRVKKIRLLRNAKTGSDYELGFRKLVKFLNKVSLLVNILYFTSPIWLPVLYGCIALFQRILAILLAYYNR